MLLGDRRPPGDRRAVPADQRHRPDDHAGGLGHAERHRADGADQVLQEHEGDRDEAEDAEDAPARRQIREPGIHPDRREEDDEQPVPRRHVEADVDSEDGVHPPERQGSDEATGDRFRDAVAAQERHPLGDEHADKKDDDADREGKEVRCDEARNIGHDGSMIVMMRVKPIVAGSSASYAPRGGDRKHRQSNRCGVPVLSTFGALAAEVPAEPGGRTPSSA